MEQTGICCTLPWYDTRRDRIYSSLIINRAILVQLRIIPSLCVGQVRISYVLMDVRRLYWTCVEGRRHSYAQCAPVQLTQIQSWIIVLHPLDTPMAYPHQNCFLHLMSTNKNSWCTGKTPDVLGMNHAWYMCTTSFYLYSSSLDLYSDNR